MGGRRLFVVDVGLNSYRRKPRRYRRPQENLPGWRRWLCSKLTVMRAFTEHLFFNRSAFIARCCRSVAGSAILSAHQHEFLRRRAGKGYWYLGGLVWRFNSACATSRRISVG